MMRRSWAKALGLAAAFLAGSLLTDAARAGVIGSYDGSYGGGYATINGSIGPVEENDAEPEGAGGVSPNVLDVSKTFTSLNPIDMVFTVNNSGGVTSYLFDEDVTNLTGFKWTDYHFEVGIGIGAAFQRFAPGSLVEFDPTNPSSTDSFNNLLQTPVTVDWRGPPGVPNGAVALFHVQLLIFDIAAPDTSYSFTLRQYPTIPEPSSVILLGVGSAGLLGMTLRRRRFAPR